MTRASAATPDNRGRAPSVDSSPSSIVRPIGSASPQIARAIARFTIATRSDRRRRRRRNRGRATSGTFNVRKNPGETTFQSASNASLSPRRTPGVRICAEAHAAAVERQISGERRRLDAGLRAKLSDQIRGEPGPCDRRCILPATGPASRRQRSSDRIQVGNSVARPSARMKRPAMTTSRSEHRDLADEEHTAQPEARAASSTRRPSARSPDPRAWRAAPARGRRPPPPTATSAFANARTLASIGMSIPIGTGNAGSNASNRPRSQPPSTIPSPPPAAKRTTISTTS